MQKAPEKAAAYTKSKYGDRPDIEQSVRERFEYENSLILKRAMTDFKKDDESYQKALSRATGDFKEKTSKLSPKNNVANKLVLSKTSKNEKGSMPAALRRKISEGLKRFYASR